MAAVTEKLAVWVAKGNARPFTQSGATRGVGVVPTVTVKDFVTDLRPSQLPGKYGVEVDCTG